MQKKCWSTSVQKRRVTPECNIPLKKENNVAAKDRPVCLIADRPVLCNIKENTGCILKILACGVGACYGQGVKGKTQSKKLALLIYHPFREE